MQGRTQKIVIKIGSNLLCCSCLGKMVFWVGFFCSRFFCCADLQISYSGLIFLKGHQSWLPRSRKIPQKRGSHNRDGICDIFPPASSWSWTRDRHVVTIFSWIEVNSMGLTICNRTRRRGGQDYSFNIKECRGHFLGLTLVQISIS